MMQQTKDAVIDLLESELEKEISFLENERCNRDLTYEDIKRAWVLRSSLFDIYRIKTRYTKDMSVYTKRKELINKKMKELKGALK